MDTPTVAAFRAQFPEFSEVVATDAQISLWLNIGSIMLPECVWKRMWPLAVMLFAAHNVSLSILRQGEAAAGGAPGIARGVVASEAGGSLSVGYDTAATLQKDAGQWNYTTYGQYLAQLMSYFGMGGVQVGAGNAPYVLAVPFTEFACGPGWTGGGGSPW